jgi:hypothetical protein
MAKLKLNLVLSTKNTSGEPLQAVMGRITTKGYCPLIGELVEFHNHKKKQYRVIGKLASFKNKKSNPSITLIVEETQDQSNG